VAEQTASVTPQKNNQTQGNQKKMNDSNLKNWLTSMKDNTKDTTVKELDKSRPQSGRSRN